MSFSHSLRGVPHTNDAASKSSLVLVSLSQDQLAQMRSELDRFRYNLEQKDDSSETYNPECATVMKALAAESSPCN
eukprot:6241814-Amphidinium_carterae.1